MCSACGASSAALTESSSTTSAITMAPVIGLRFGLTSDMRTRGSAFNTPSTSSGNTFIPPTLMTPPLRPRK